jgi:hypothetical protein
MLKTSIKAAPLPSLLTKTSETGVQDVVPVTAQGDEKLVTIVTSAPEKEKKKRKLKKPSVIEANESNET